MSWSKKNKEPRMKMRGEKMERMPKEKGIMPIKPMKANVGGMHPTQNLIVNAKSMGGY